MTAIASGGFPGTFVSSRYSADAADVDAPHPDLHLDVGEIDGDLHARSAARRAPGVDAGVRLLLPAVGVEVLVEVPLGVQQPDADERHAEVGRRLQMVAGEHPEPTGVLRERLGDAELGREVGDEIERRALHGLGFAGHVRPCREPVVRSVGEVTQSTIGGGDIGHELVVVREPFPAGG